MKIIKKIPGGKLLTVEWETEKDAQDMSDHTGDKITFFRLSGDFFAHPEWCVEEIEKSLIGKKASDIQKLMEEKIKANNLQIIGFSASDIQKIIMEDFG